MKTFQVAYANQPWRNRSFGVRGVCQNDILNPCWDNRQTDISGKFWGDPEIPSCAACTEAARKHMECLAA